MKLIGAGWSSLAARRAHNPKVGGSNPSPATISLTVVRGIDGKKKLKKLYKASLLILLLLIAIDLYLYLPSALD